MDFIKWPKVNQLHNVRKAVKARKRYHEVEGLAPYQPPSVSYRGKIKLDGTNAALRINRNEFATQSRSRIITPEDDNMGFATWAHNSGWIQEFDGDTTATLTVFGEWCGKGIQKRCSISKIDRKIFAVFAVLVEYPGGESVLRVQPEDIRLLIPQHPDVFVLPWVDSLTVDHAMSAEELEPTVALVNNNILQVEACDPWVLNTFGVEGLGEGIVYYPIHTWLEGRDGMAIAGEYLGHTTESLGEWGFKAKGEEHQVVRQKAPVILDTEKVAGVEAFVEKFVTPNRLDQGLREACGGEADSKLTGAFLKWFGMDVKNESADELEASGLEWKDVSKGVTLAAKTWFQKECNK